MKHTISVLVENKFGVLARIAGLFSGRGYNIDSLSVAETVDPTVSRMTIVARGEEAVIEQITKQLNKLVDVIKVQDYAGTAFLERELILVKVHTTSQTRAEIIQIVDIFRGKIVDVDRAGLTVELTGTEDKIAALLDLLKPFGIKELVRTGKIAIARK
ncbi:MAG: acetolactate synthase small subunit [Candidatus Aureabacteria bacterium]|nr:acetolactate synthase small subunit [Candidatus Auribacterota bacterium]